MGCRTMSIGLSGRSLRAALMLSCSFLSPPMLASAQDATWVGPGSTLTDGNNWSAGTVPTGVATFATQGPASATVGSSASADFGSLVFASGSKAYTITLNSGTMLLRNGGVINNSGLTQTILVGSNSSLTLLGNSTLADLQVTGTSASSGAKESRLVKLQGSVTGGTARLENVTLSLAGNASADRITLVNGDIIAADSATLGSSNIELSSGAAGVVRDTATLGNATLTIRSGASLRPAGNTTGGTASITVEGSGQFQISSVSAPTFTISSLAGNGRVTLGDKTLVLDGPGSNFGGVFNGTSLGGVTFARGVSSLSGTGSSMGAITVNSGASLYVNGSVQLSNLAYVASGGTLGGTGTIGGRTLVDGTLSPGGSASSIGGLTVGGSLVMGPGATTEIDVAATGSDLITVTGTAIPDGRLQVAPIVGALPTNGQKFTILDARSVQGTFSSTASTLAYYNFVPTYSGTSVTLTTEQLNFAAKVASQNKKNLVTSGGALDTYVSNVGLVPTVSSTTPVTTTSTAGATTTTTTTTPATSSTPATTTTTITTTTVAASTATASTITTTTPATSTTPATTTTATTTPASGTTPATTTTTTVRTAARNEDLDRVALQLLSLTAPQATAALHSISGESYAGYTTVALEQLDRFRRATMDAAGACESRGGALSGRFCSWADAYYSRGSLKGAGDLAGFKYALAGLQAGIETKIESDTVLGVSIGYGKQQTGSYDFASRRFDGDSVFAGVNGAYNIGPWQVAGLVGYSRFDVDARRDIAVGNISRQAHSNFGANGVNAATALRYSTEWEGVKLVPDVMLAYAHYWQNAFTEKGAGSLNLRIGSTNSSSVITSLGVTASTDLSLNGAPIRPFVTLRYEHDWLAGEKADHKINASFASVPESGSWTVFGQNRGQHNFIGRIGAIGEVSSNLSLFGSVGGQLNSNGSEWGLSAGVRMSF